MQDNNWQVVAKGKGFGVRRCGDAVSSCFVHRQNDGQTAAAHSTKVWHVSDTLIAAVKNSQSRLSIDNSSNKTKAIQNQGTE